jgi:hypothetical protein
MCIIQCNILCDMVPHMFTKPKILYVQTVHTGMTSSRAGLCLTVACPSCVSPHRVGCESYLKLWSSHLELSLDLRPKPVQAYVHKLLTSSSSSTSSTSSRSPQMHCTVATGRTVQPPCALAAWRVSM